MKNQPERLQERAIRLTCPECGARKPEFRVRGQFCSCGWQRDRPHIVAAGGQDISEDISGLCECEEERAGILEFDGRMSRDAAVALVLESVDVPRCDRCPRGKP